MQKHLCYVLFHGFMISFILQGVKKNWTLGIWIDMTLTLWKIISMDKQWVKTCEMPLIWLGNFLFWCRNPLRRPLNAHMGQEKPYKAEILKSIFLGHPVDTTTCSHWNHCKWSKTEWEQKCLLLKNCLRFWRFMVEWVTKWQLKIW